MNYKYVNNHYELLQYMTEINLVIDNYIYRVINSMDMIK